MKTIVFISLICFSWLVNAQTKIDSIPHPFEMRTNSSGIKEKVYKTDYVFTDTLITNDSIFNRIVVHFHKESTFFTKEYFTFEVLASDNELSLYRNYGPMWKDDRLGNETNGYMLFITENGNKLNVVPESSSYDRDFIYPDSLSVFDIKNVKIDANNRISYRDGISFLKSEEVIKVRLSFTRNDVLVKVNNMDVITEMVKLSYQYETRRVVTVKQ